MPGHIEILSPDDFEQCGSIWDIHAHEDLAKRFYKQLVSKQRITFVYRQDGILIGEVSLVFETDDPDYTVPNRRAYFSRFLVVEGFRNRGIGSALAQHVFHYAGQLGYNELSVGVDLVNFDALRLYHRLGFDRILNVEEDEGGKYLKLLRQL